MSTSDPTIFLGVAVTTITLLGAAVSWCLNQWKTLEDIRKLRAETANLKGVPAAEELAARFDKIIEERVAAEVNAEATRLVESTHADGARKNELLTHVEKSLIGLLARIERGMTVEIRLLPQPKGAKGAEDDEDRTAFSDLAQIQKQLVFPPPSGDPILQIPKMADGSAEKKKDTPPEQK